MAVAIHTGKKLLVFFLFSPTIKVSPPTSVNLI